MSGQEWPKANNMQTAEDVAGREHGPSQDGTVSNQGKEATKA
jgi:hypothetical protein